MRHAKLFRWNQILTVALFASLFSCSFENAQGQSVYDSLIPGNSSHQASGPIRWLESADAALLQSQQTGKPILAYVTSDHCGYCRKMDRESWSSPRIVRQVNQQFIPLKINAARQPEQARALQVQAFPTTLLVTQDGRVATGSAGFLPAEKLTNLLRQADALTQRTPPQVMPVSTH